MRLKIVGTGSSGNAYVLENDGEALLIECGVKISDIKKELGFDYSKVAGCIVTHEHGDHAHSINDVMSLGIDVHASKGTFDCTAPFGNHRAKIIKARQQFMVGNFKVMPFDIQHDASEPLGFLISHKDCGNVLFLTDTFYCKYKFPNLNNIIIEANYSKEIIDRKFGPESGKEFLRNRILKSHFSLENCKAMLSANDLSKVNNIVLIHLSDSNSNERQFHEEVAELTGKNVTVARNGMGIEFNKTPF